MKILTGEQVKEADRYTVEHEPVESIVLMERAAEMIAQAIGNRIETDRKLLFLTGKGNNGGDGLAAARILSNAGFTCSICMVRGDNDLSDESGFNYKRLPRSITFVKPEDVRFIDSRVVIVDAILGSGATGKANGIVTDLIRLVNSLSNDVISIDLPSGMRTEFDNCPDNIIHANVTLTIEFPKLAMLLPEAGELCGEIEILPVGLDTSWAKSDYFYTEKIDLQDILKPRLKFGHKGNYGHALLICGSGDMAGAAILSTCGALRSGCGLVTTHLPDNKANALHANAPSAMVSGDPNDRFTTLPVGLEKFSTLGIGCGLGVAPESISAVLQLFKVYNKPMVIDADALNIIADRPELRLLVPEQSILTPHIAEFKRLVGKWNGESEKLAKLRGLASELNSVVILKGSYSAVCMPDGRIRFNSTGSSGMAKAGMGDVLTGLLTGILAQGYSPENTAVIGTWIHGRAGEKAQDYFGGDGMNSADIIDFIPEAWSEIR